MSLSRCVRARRSSHELLRTFLVNQRNFTHVCGRSLKRDANIGMGDPAKIGQALFELTLWRQVPLPPRRICWECRSIRGAVFAPLFSVNGDAALQAAVKNLSSGGAAIQGSKYYYGNSLMCPLLSTTRDTGLPSFTALKVVILPDLISRTCE